MINASTGLGRVSLITGGASPVGLGAAAGRVFAREGAKVVIADLPSKEASGQAVVAELNKIRAGSAIWVPLDVTKEAEWDRAVGEIEKKLGPLDVLFNKWVSFWLHITMWCLLFGGKMGMLATARRAFRRSGSGAVTVSPLSSFRPFYIRGWKHLPST